MNYIKKWILSAFVVSILFVGCKIAGAAERVGADAGARLYPLELSQEPDVLARLREAFHGDEEAMIAHYLKFRRLIPKRRENSALLEASASNLYDNATMALALGANIEATDRDGNTPLHKTTCGQIKTAEFLLSHGANINAKNKEGLTPLHWAVLWDSASMVELLVKNGANIWAKTNKGETPLAMANRRNRENGVLDKATHGRVAALLRSHGAWDFSCCLQ